MSRSNFPLLAAETVSKRMWHCRCTNAVLAIFELSEIHDYVKINPMAYTFAEMELK